MTEKIEKLPKWAQEHIRDLGRALEAAKAALADHELKQEKTPYHVWEARFPNLRGGPEIGTRYIKAPGGVQVECGFLKINVRADEEEGTIKINCHSGRIGFKPMASNAIDLYDAKE